MTDKLRRAGLALAMIALAVAAVHAVAVHFAAPVLPEDDAFIIFRYADNIARGAGPVYNPGERVFGASTPLYVALLAGIKAVASGAETPSLAVRLGALFFVASGIGLVFLLRRLGAGTGFAALFGAGFLLRDDLLRASTGGMEAFLFTGLLAWCLWALAGRRWRPAALFAGLSAVTRPEGVLACLLVLAAWLVLDRRKSLAVLAGVLIPGLAWVVFGWAYYGTPVFQSLVAKTAPLYPLPPGHALGRMLVELERRLAGVLGNSETPEKWALSWRTGVAVLLVAAGIIGCRFGRTTEDGRRLPFACLLPAASLVLMVAFYAVSNPLMFPWYYPALVFLLYALVSTGAAGLVGSRHQVARAAGVAAVALLLVLSAHGPVGRLVSGRSAANVGVASDPVRARVLAYRAAADWLNENLPPGTEVTASEVGSLGYYYDGPVFDCCGLVSPAAVRFQPGEADERSHPTQGVIPRRLVFERRPEVIVTMPVFARRSLFSQDWFWDLYVGVAQFPLPVRLWGSSTVDVLVRAGKNPGHFPISANGAGALLIRLPQGSEAHRGKAWGGDGNGEVSRFFPRPPLDRLGTRPRITGHDMLTCNRGSCRS